MPSSGWICCCPFNDADLQKPTHFVSATVFFLFYAVCLVRWSSLLWQCRSVQVYVQETVQQCQQLFKCDHEGVPCRENISVMLSMTHSFGSRTARQDGQVLRQPCMEGVSATCIRLAPTCQQLFLQLWISFCI